ncbi:MAG: STAS domain-containing protein [Solirubrobacteraceae bacterium]
MAVIRVAGELDVASAPRLEQEVAGAVAESPSAVVIDLARLDFMDSTGLRAILGAQELTGKSGQRFVLLRGPEQVERLLTLTRVADRIEIAEDLDAVLASVGNNGG